MHVHHAPRREHSLLVGIAECIEYRRNALYAVLHSEIVCRTSHRTDTLARLTEYVGLIVFLKLAEHLLGHPFGHKLSPRILVNNVGKVVDGDLVVLSL